MKGSTSKKKEGGITCHLCLATESVTAPQGQAQGRVCAFLCKRLRVPGNSWASPLLTLHSPQLPRITLGGKVNNNPCCTPTPISTECIEHPRSPAGLYGRRRNAGFILQEFTVWRGSRKRCISSYTWDKMLGLTGVTKSNYRWIMSQVGEKSLGFCHNFMSKLIAWTRIFALLTVLSKLKHLHIFKGKLRFCKPCIYYNYN